MSVRSLQDQVSALLNKGVVQPKVAGTNSPDVESASLMESLALSLLLQPKAALYDLYLAKSGLLAAITAEIVAIEALKSAIQDLGNVTFAIKDLQALQRAQSSILQLSAQGLPSSSSGAFKRFSVSIDEFLNQQLAKNIKRPGSSVMVRPGEEAGLDLPPSLSSLKDQHTAFLDRLYALSVGVKNFLSTPFSAIVGANTLFRARADLDGVISDFSTDDSGAQSRDAAVRLIADRAALRLVGATVDVEAPVLDTGLVLPAGQPAISGMSAPTSAVSSTAAGPFVMSTGGTLVINGTSTTNLNQAGNHAAVLGDAVVFPVSVPANYHLFFNLEAVAGLTWTGPDSNGLYTEGTLGSGWSLVNGVYSKDFKATLNSGDPSTTPPGSAAPLSMSLADVEAAFDTAIGALGTAVEFVTTGTGRLLLVASSVKINKITIIHSMVVIDSRTTIPFPHVYSNSFHVELGFSSSPSGVTGSTPASRIAAALGIIFPAVASSVLNPDGTISLTSVNTAPGASLTVSGVWAADLGLATAQAVSTLVTLQSAGGPVSPLGLVDPGDVLKASTGTAVVASVRDSGMTLVTPLPTFSGPITITSALISVWLEIEDQVSAFLIQWLQGPFASDLASVDRLIAVLIGSPTSPRRSEALAVLNDLEAQLSGLQVALSSPAATLPVGSAAKERKAVEGVIQTLIERKYDRALDFFLRCQIQELFELDWQTASYSGNLMRAAADIARSDIKFPDSTKDEGYEVQGLRTRGGQ